MSVNGIISTRPNKLKKWFMGSPRGAYNKNYASLYAYIQASVIDNAKLKHLSFLRCRRFAESKTHMDLEIPMPAHSTIQPVWFSSFAKYV